jgi:hypothetical protein
MKTPFNVCLVVLLVVVSAVIFMIEHGSPVPRKGLQPFHVTDHHTSQPSIVSIDGSIFSSSLAVTSVSQRREGDCIIILVRQGIMRPGRRSGRFHLDVDVSNGIEAIGYENAHDIIWHR